MLDPAYYDKNSAGNGGRRCDTPRKTKSNIHGHHHKRYEEEWADGRQHSWPQELENDSIQGDPLMWKNLQGEKLTLYMRMYDFVWAYRA